MIFEGDELRAGHVVNSERRALLCGFKDHRHAAVGDELDVQAEDEVFGVTQLEGNAFCRVCGGVSKVGVGAAQRNVCYRVGGVHFIVCIQVHFIKNKRITSFD